MEGLDLIVGEAVLLPIGFAGGRLPEGAAGGVEFGEVANCRRAGGGGHCGVRGVGWASAPTREFYITEGGDDKRPQKELGVQLFADGGHAFGELIGVLDAVDHRDGGEYRQNPEDRGHDSPLLEEGSEEDEDDALGSLHEADFAFANESFGAGARVADHQGRDHDKGDEDHVTEAVDSPVVDEKAEEEDNVGIAVDDGVEEGSEDCHLVGLASDAPVDHVEEAGAEDNAAGVEEHDSSVGSVGLAEEEGGNDVDDEADEGEHVGRDSCKGQTMNDPVK